MTPPVTSLENSKPEPEGSGSKRTVATPNCPWPPLCFLYLPSTSIGAARVARYGDAHIVDVEFDAGPLDPRQRDADVGLPATAEHGLARSSPRGGQRVWGPR